MTTPDPVVDRELEELARALAADAPKADPAFEAKLRERVEQGFPRERRSRRRPLPRLLRPVVGVAASLLVAIAVAVPLILGGEALEQSTDDAAESGGSVQPAPSLGGGDSSGGGGAAELSRPQARTRGDFTPNRSDRRIERSAALTLAAPEGELDRVANEIVAVTDRLGGFVLRSSVSTGAEGTATGSFELRLPARDLQGGLAELSRLGDVRARTQAGQDITRGFVTAADRLEAARAEREGLLGRLEQAGTDTEAEAIRTRLDQNAAEIDGLRGRLRDLRLRSDFATVSVTLERAARSDAADQGGAGSGDGLGAALDDALGTLAASLELLVRALGLLIPLGLLAGALALGARTVRRRRREQALA